jgi:hypothetical protein
MTLNIVGTRNSVAQMAKSRPPITARPSGAFVAWLDRHRRHADDHRERRHQHRPDRVLPASRARSMPSARPARQPKCSGILLIGNRQRIIRLVQKWLKAGALEDGS